MSDPGTCLAIVSLALQVSKGLLGYYDLWTHADEDVAEIQRSLLALGNIFTQLKITLGKPNLSQDIISIIRISMKGCDANVKKLEEILNKVKRDGPPEKIRTKIKNLNRRMLHMFHHGEILRLQAVLNELREDLNMAVSLLSLNTTATSLDDLRKVHGELTSLNNSLQGHDTKDIERKKEKARESLRATLIEWLDAPDVCAAHLSARDQWEEGTGGWFLESQEFINWANYGGSMWLAGDVGCGKTVLCSSVIEALKSRAPKRDDRIAYFYFTFNDPGCHGMTGFLRSMLRQLCLPGSTDPLIEALHHRCSPDPPSIKQMQATLLAYLTTACALDKGAKLAQKPQVYMVLDGLDEIPYGQDRTMLLRLLDQLAEKAFPLLHILVSSRPERDIEMEILGNQEWRTFHYSSGVKNDLEIYVANQIKLTPRLASLPDRTKQDIKEKLVTGAGGMFRWAALQMQELKKKRVLRGRDVQNILSSLPKSLDATYERVLLQIDSDLVYEAKTALQWLSCCIRPLYLEELVDASIINPDDETPFSEDFRINPFDLVDLLPGLIKVNPSPDSIHPTFIPRNYTVTLAHFSVKEYLVSSRLPKALSYNYAINLELAHSLVVRSSLAYIRHCLSIGSSYPHQQESVDNFPLQLYAYSRWEMHAQLVPDLLDQVWPCVLGTFKQPAAALMWRASSWRSRKLREESAVYHFDIPFQGFSSPNWPTHYLFCRAIISGNESLVRFILDGGLDLTDTPILGNPFHLALICSYKSRHRAMIRSGCRSLVSRSLSSSSDTVPRMLLEFGYRPAASDLLLAVHYASTRLLSLMIDRTENVSSSEMIQGLGQAVALGRFQIAHILMQQLLSGTHAHLKQGFYTQDKAKKAIIELMFRIAVEKDSLRLVSYLLGSTREDLAGQLDLDSLFLWAVVSGKRHIAAAIRQAWRISEKARISAERWQGLMVCDELCFAVLVMFTTRCRRPKPQAQTRAARKKRSRSLIQPYVFGLKGETIDQILQTWLRIDESFEPLHTQDPFIHSMPSKMAIPPSGCTSRAAKLVTFLSLNSPHSSSLWDLCCQAISLYFPLERPAGPRDSFSMDRWAKPDHEIDEELQHLHNALMYFTNNNRQITCQTFFVNLGPTKQKSVRLLCAYSRYRDTRRGSLCRHLVNRGKRHSTTIHQFNLTHLDGKCLGHYHLVSRFDPDQNTRFSDKDSSAIDVHLYRDVLTVNFSAKTPRAASLWLADVFKLVDKAMFAPPLDIRTTLVENCPTGALALALRQNTVFRCSALRSEPSMHVKFFSTLLKTRRFGWEMKFSCSGKLLQGDGHPDTESTFEKTPTTLSRVLTELATSSSHIKLKVELIGHGGIGLDSEPLTTFEMLRIDEGEHRD